MPFTQPEAPQPIQLPEPMPDGLLDAPGSDRCAATLAALGVSEAFGIVLAYCTDPVLTPYHGSRERPPITDCGMFDAITPDDRLWPERLLCIPDPEDEAPLVVSIAYRYPRARDFVVTVLGNSINPAQRRESQPKPPPQARRVRVRR